MGPGHETADLQQGLGEAAGAEAPERRDADAIQPEGHRSVRPEVLKAVSGHAQDHQQRAAGGHHVPEIGGIAQAEEDEQVVQQHGQDQAIDQAEKQVLAHCLLLQGVELPDLERKGVAGRIVAAQIKGQRALVAKLRQAEQHAPVGVVAPFVKADQLAGLTLGPATVAVRQIDAQVFQGHRANFQPPSRRRVAGPLQRDPNPPGVRALADAGLALRRLKARLHLRALQVRHLQLGAGIHQQFHMGIQTSAAVMHADQGGIGMGWQERA